MINFGSSRDKEIIDKIEKFAEETDHRLDKIEKVLIANDLNLQEHMRRSDSLESMILNEKEERRQEMARLEANDAEMLTHKNKIEGGIKLLGIIATVSGIIFGFLKFMN